MKILPIFFNNLQKNYKSANINKSNFLINPLPFDTVSFGSKKHTYGVKDARELDDLPCACCGHIMTKNSSVNKFLNEKIYFPASQALILMQKEGFILNEQPREIRNAFEFLYVISQKYKKQTVAELLSMEQVKNYRKHLSVQENLAFDEICEQSKLIAHNSSYMIKAISSLNPDFQPIERAVFNELKTLSKKYPEETFFDILNRSEVKSKYLDNLKYKQMNILNNIDVLKEDLPRRYQFVVDDCINKSKEIFTNEQDVIIHKRKRVIEMFELALDRIKANKTAKKIIEEINNLPNSQTDVDAFMIKSSQKTSNSLAETLVTRTRSTREHVIPKHRVGHNGENSIHNYIYLCSKCNVKRKMTEYSKFVEDYPDMPANTQRQMDTMIRHINRGNLIGYDDWPDKIKVVLNEESGATKKHNGKINVNVGNLDIDYAIRNRERKKKRYVAECRSKNEKKYFKY